MSRKSSIRKVTALVSAIIFASSSYCTSFQVLAEEQDVEWARNINEWTAKYLDNENNCELNFVYNSNSGYDSRTQKKIDEKLTKIIFNDNLSEEMIISKNSVLKVAGTDDGEITFDTSVYSFSIDNTNYYYSLKKITVSTPDYITVATIELDELAVFTNKIQKDASSYYISVLDKTNVEETCKLRLDGIFEYNKKFYAKKIDSGYKVSFDMSFGWVCDFPDKTLNVPSNQISIDIDGLKNYISLSQNSIIFSDTKNNSNILINGKSDYSQKFSDIRNKCIISTSNDDLWIKEIKVNNHSVFLAKDEFKKSVDIASLLDMNTDVTKEESKIEVKTFNKLITIPIYYNQKGQDIFLKQEQYEVQIDYSNTYINVDSYILNENGIANYILSSFQFTNSLTKKDYNIYPQKDESDEFVKICFDNYDNCRLNYQSIQLIDEQPEELNSILLKYAIIKDKNKYYTSNELLSGIFDRTDNFDFSYILNDRYSNKDNQTKQNRKILDNIFDIFPRIEDLSIIRGTINETESDITNSLTSPIYIYNDQHSPIISPIPENTTWTNTTQTLTFKAHDFILEYPDPYTNETKKFSSDITSFNIGAAKITKNAGSWKIEQGEDSLYQIQDFKQNGDEYTVVFKTEGDTDCFENINITAVDEFGNISDPQQYTLRFDKKAPEIMSISGENEIRDIDGEMSVYISDMNSDTITLKAVPVDLFEEISSVSSGIAGGEIIFEESNDTYSAKLENGNLVFEIPNTARAERFYISVKDNAGNDSKYRFAPGESHVSLDEYSLFVIDKCAPVITSSLKNSSNAVQKTLNGNQTWFTKYPEIIFTTKDHLSEKCNDESCNEIVSGLSRNIISYVGEDGKNYSFVYEAQGAGSFSGKLKIIDNNGDNSKVDISLIDKAGNVIDILPTGSKEKTGCITVPKNMSGKFEFKIRSVDRSDRESEESVQIFYVDNQDPKAEEVLNINSKKSEEFGTFSNEDIIIEALVHDAAPSSGVEGTTLYVGNRSFTGVYLGNDKWQYKINKGDAPVSGEISILMRDKAGNVSNAKTVRNPEGSNFLMIENNKPESYPEPVLKAVTGRAPYICKNENNEECRWFNGDVDIEFWWKDTESGMDYSRVSVFNKDKKLVDWSDNFKFSNFAGSAWNNRSDTSSVKIQTPENEDGKITFIFEGTDNCGNKAEASETVYKDTTAPQIVSVVTAETEKPTVLTFREWNELNYADKLQRYDYFSQKSIKLVITAEDLNASSGLSYIAYNICSHDGTVIRTDSKKFTDNQIVIDNIPEDFKGYVTAKAYDNVGNESTLACVYGMISESEACHLENSDIKISFPETEYTDVKGNKLYNKDITVNVSAEDSFSGINTISWRIENDGDGYFEENKIGTKDLLTGDESYGNWIISDFEKNLVNGLFAGISKENNANELKMEVNFTDNAGHSLKESACYSIDKDKPELTASFLPAHNDEQYTNIFNTPRTASVQIRERNFNADDTYIDAPGASVGSFALISGREGANDALYEAKVTFENDGEYKYSAVSYDRCKNASDKYESETFIIDRTAPKISVDFADTASNGKYYNANRKAVITVTEQNFDENRINVAVTLNGKTANLPKLSAWKHDGNVHTAQMTFTKEGEYTLSVSGSDKASNQAAETFKTEFVIDKTTPNITFRGIKNKSANRGSSSFSVRLTDKYLDTDTINIKIDGAQRGDDLKIESKKKNITNGVEISFANLPEEKEYDDVYHVTVTAKDKAGNPVKETLDYSVNRFGSTYVFDEATKNISRKYVKEPIDVVIHEINPDKLDPDKTVVVFAKDGISHIMKENEGFKLDVTGGNGKWYDYKYTFGVENFKEDGAYYIMMYSKDAAGNANTNQQEGKNAELRFGIDSTPPHLASVDLKTNGSYRAKDYYTARIRTVDLMFKELHVFLNDSEVEEETKCVDEYTYTFEVPAMESPQKIKVIGYDYAGNKTEIEVENVLVNPSIMKVLFHRLWFRLLLAALAGLAGWGISKFVKRKKAIHDMAVKLKLK